MKTLLPTQKSDYSPNKLKSDTDKRNYIFPGLSNAIVIPAYNEELSLGKTLKKIPTNLSDKMEIVVIDDGSIDNTSIIANKYNVNLLKHSRNRGNGAAVKTGLNFCKNKKYDIAVILDADGQHNPMYLSDFIKPIVEDNVDFVIGNRFKYYYRMNPYKKFCSKLMTAFYFLLLRKKISDPTNGYRALSSKLINRIEFESEYSLTQEMLFKIIPKYNFMEIPIIVEKREHGKSFIKLNNYLNKITLLFIKYYIFRKLKKVINRLLSKETRDKLGNIFRT